MIGSMGYVATTVFAAAPPRFVDVRRGCRSLVVPFGLVMGRRWAGVMV
jgi:hypothetical protein